MDTGTLTDRERAILHAVAAGRAELLVSCAPDLRIDGGWCDHTAVTRLVLDGWIRPVRPAAAGELVPAQLTDAAAGALGGRCRRSA
ncbi:hypothetical protein [Amycolatopsis sp. NPDC051061]|uniref:hypothetical protein n=1 Tax=Amycolatopsis sp. NPDC051061 TaxID=3155042 RepID=UPI0034210791